MSKRKLRYSWVKLMMVLAMVGALLPISGLGPVYADLNPAPVQIFYVTLPEDQALSVFNAIHSTSVTPIYTYFSIAIGVSGTYVYYDQWEDGYASDIANPTSDEIYSASNLDGVQIWGNGESDDGCAPNIFGVGFSCTDANDVLHAGDVIIPYNAVAVPNGSGTIEFDGKDKVGASASIAMARATWPTGPGTQLAFAHEMYATAEWGTEFESPLGTNTTIAGSMVEYAALSIMASQNNTTVQIDSNADGSTDSTVVILEGGSTLVTGILQGAKVTSDKPVQVVLLIGDIGALPYGSRDINLLPLSVWGSDAWSPVGVELRQSPNDAGPTRLFLYSPSAGGPTCITCVRRSPTPTTVTQAVSARGVVTVDLSDYSGAHCYASDSSGNATGEPIFGIGVVDAYAGSSRLGNTWDWGFTLYPEKFLTTEALVGLGLGRDPNATSSTSSNDSPVWVTAVCDTYVYVDWQEDDTGDADLVDLNGDGDTNDTVDGIAESTTNNGFLVTALQSVRLFEPGNDEEPYDQSGARVWSRTASGVGYGGTPGCKLALAWGEDPDAITGGAAPGLDMGTSVPPLRPMEGTKASALKDDVNGDGVLSPGDIATYNITIRNAGSVLVANVHVYDQVPANTAYVLDSTKYNKTGTEPWTAIPDDQFDTPFPLDAPGGVWLGNLEPNETFYVRFEVTLNIGSDYEEILNCDTVYYDGGSFTRCVTTFVASRDWGDLPDSYGTSAAQNGPRHSYSGLKLGANFDYEVQGQPTTGASGDDLATSDDEDGIAIVGVGTREGWPAGNGKFNVTVTGGPGCLNAWMDINGDGDFADTVSGKSEHIIVNQEVNEGTTEVAVSVPPMLGGWFYFRFRLSPLPCGSIDPTGFVAGGEVEDYRFYLDIPEAVTLASFTAMPGLGGVLVAWETASEINNLGFNLYRTEENNYESPSKVKLNETQIPSQSPGSNMGATYTFLDSTALEGVLYYYWLEDIEADGDYKAMGVSWSVSSQWNKPTTGAVSPNSGGKSYKKVQAFKATFSDADGDLGIVSLKFSETVVASYNLATKAAGVSGDAVLKKCSVSGDGRQLTVTWKLKFKKQSRGQYDLYLSAQDSPGNRADWTLAGAWDVK